MIVLGGSNVANDELIGYVAMTLSPSGTTSMNTDNITITPIMTVANGVPKVGATASIPAGTLSSNVTKSSGTIDKSDLVETLTVTKNGAQNASDKLWNKVIVNVDTTSGVSIQTSKTATLSTSDDVTVTPDTNYDAMATVVVPKVPLEERSVTLSSSQTLTPSGSNLGFSKVTVNVNSGTTIKNQTKSTSMPTSGASLTVYPDTGYTGLDSVTISALNLQSKSVNPSGSVQTVKADSGYHGLSQVTVAAVTSSGTTSNIQSSKTFTDITGEVASNVGIITLKPDTGYDGMAQVVINSANLFAIVPEETDQEQSSDNILSDKYYYESNVASYSHGLRLTKGTMPNNGAVSGSITTNGGTYTIPKGYHNGNGTVTANIALNAYYVGTTVPDASLGNDGDIYLKT